MRALTLRAGPDALRIIRERGLRAEDVDVVPGASGGPKWLVLAGLDRFFLGEFFNAPRERPLHLIGSSIGSWRLACLAQRDPLAALARAHEAYLARREQIGYVPELAGVSAGGMPGRVKCLHVLVAHALAAGPGVNPLGDEALAELPHWWAAGPCVPS